MDKPTTVKCFPCEDKGMKYVIYRMNVDRKSKLKKYCFMKQITITSLMSALLAKEFAENYEKEETKYKRRRLHARAKAYRYILSRKKQ